MPCRLLAATAGNGSKSFVTVNVIAGHNTIWRLLIVSIEFFSPCREMSRYPLSAEGAGEVQGQTYWPNGLQVLLLIDCDNLRFGGGSRTGGHLARLVLRSHKTTAQERGAAHGPSTLAVSSFPATLM